VTTLILLAVLLRRLVLKLQGRDLSSIAKQHKVNNRLRIPDAKVSTGGGGLSLQAQRTRQQNQTQYSYALGSRTKPNTVTAQQDAVRCFLDEWFKISYSIHLPGFTLVHARLNCPVTTSDRDRSRGVDSES
jgi:hypothetical protein